MSLLEDADFAGAFTAHVSTKGDFRVFAHDLSDCGWRRFVLTKNNRVAFCCAGHTLAIYRALPFGWRTTPPEVPTDLYMWRQFLSQRCCRAVSGNEPTALTFPSPRHLDCPIQRRLDELEHWTQQICSEQGRLRYVAPRSERRGRMSSTALVGHRRVRQPVLAALFPTIKKKARHVR